MSLAPEGEGRWAVVGTADGSGGEHRWGPAVVGGVGERCFCVILSRSLDATEKRNVGACWIKVFMVSLRFFQKLGALSIFKHRHEGAIWERLTSERGRH